MGRPIEEYKALLDKSTASRGPDGVPNVSAIAADANGKILYSVSSGSHVPNPKDPSASINPGRRAFTPDTVCWIASCTKLMTTVAVMQCVERGLLDLDEDVATTWLPEFKNVDILLKLEDDQDPVTVKPKNKVTLRQLLSHSTGIAYEFTHPKLFAWRQWSTTKTPTGRNDQRSTKIEVAYRVPLLFEPGQGWVYGYNIDWAGLAVMRATKMTLEDYLRLNIWKPLGMNSTSFYPVELRNDLASRLAGMSERDDSGKLSDGSGGPLARGVGHVKFAGGGGCWSTANDYIKFLSSLLKSSTASQPFEGQLISPKTAKEMFSPQLGSSATAELKKTVSSPLAFGLAGNIPVGLDVNFGLGGFLNLDAVPTTGRSGGAMQWGGLPNLFWWISPKDGICGCYFGQLMPEGDRRSFKMYELFEKAVLDDLKARGARL